MLARTFARTARCLVAAVCLAVASTALVTACSSTAQAQATADDMPTPVSADYKGMIGLGLIGAELGFVLPAIAGLHDTWAFIVFPVAGAAAGAVGGYFLLEQGAGEPELAVASLTAGMALLIPAMIITLSETAYEPERSVAPVALVQVTERGVALSTPGVSVVPGASARESLRTGASMAREVRVSLVSGQF